jgi:hypothetical protein
MEGVLTRKKKAQNQVQFQAQGDANNQETSLLNIFQAEPEISGPQITASSAVDDSQDQMSSQLDHPGPPSQDLGTRSPNFDQPDQLDYPEEDHPRQRRVGAPLYRDQSGPSSHGQYPYRDVAWTSNGPLPPASGFPAHSDQWTGNGTPVMWRNGFPSQTARRGPATAAQIDSQPMRHRFRADETPWNEERWYSANDHSGKPYGLYETQPSYNDYGHHTGDFSWQFRNPERRNPQGNPRQQNRNSAAHIKLNLPKYDGRTRWKTFINQFEAITRDWSEDQKLYHLLTCLSGDAADFVFELESHIRGSLDLLVEELERRFKTTETPQTCARQFYRRKLRSGETIKQFAADLKTLVRKAYPQGLDRSAMEQMLIKQFFDGLEDDDLRYNIEYLKMPKGLDEAVDLVYEHDEFRKVKRENIKQHKVNAVQPMKEERQLRKLSPSTAPTSAVSSQTELLEIKQALAKLTLQVNTLLNKQSPTKTEIRDRKCFKCGREGHFKRQCPEIQADRVKAVATLEEEDEPCEECQAASELMDDFMEDSAEQLN